MALCVAKRPSKEFQKNEDTSKERNRSGKSYIEACSALFDQCLQVFAFEKNRIKVSRSTMVVLWQCLVDELKQRPTFEFQAWLQGKPSTPSHRRPETFGKGSCFVWFLCEFLWFL